VGARRSGAEGARSLMLVFIHINKTAGSTLRSILRSSYGSRHCDVEPWHGAWTDPPFSAEDLRRVRSIYPRLASIAGHRISGAVDLQAAGLRYLTVVREPLKLCASRFQYRLDHRDRHDLSFEEWIEKDWARNAQTQRIGGTTDAADAIGVIERKDVFVGLTERFDESMVLLKGLRAGDLDIAYEPVNVARRNTLAGDLLGDERSRGLLEEANEADLELYRYVVEDLYPRFRREYGPALDADVAAYRSGQRGRFDRTKVARYRLKQHGLHKPLLNLYRRPWSRPAVDRLLG
jgi:hypothetical protein